MTQTPLHPQMDDPTTALNYVTDPWVIIVTKTNGRMTEVLQPYAVKGLQLTNIYNVVTFVNAFSTIAFGFALTTPWAIADDDVDARAVQFLRKRYGPERRVDQALAVQIDGIAVRQRPVLLY